MDVGGIDSRQGPNGIIGGALVPLGRCVVIAGRLNHIIALAYDLYTIVGRPDWDDTLRFDLEAKAEDPSKATEQQLLLMGPRLDSAKDEDPEISITGPDRQSARRIRRWQLDIDGCGKRAFRALWRI